tara:strand:- start:1716 stop:1979 length:264 start_codon:yes stop_codon:yes gene_type:complete
MVNARKVLEELPVYIFEASLDGGHSHRHNPEHTQPGIKLVITGYFHTASDHIENMLIGLFFIGKPRLKLLRHYIVFGMNRCYPKAKA